MAGAPIAENAAVIDANLDLHVTDTAVVGVSYNGQLAFGCSGARPHSQVDREFLEPVCGWWDQWEAPLASNAGKGETIVDPEIGRAPQSRDAHCRDEQREACETQAPRAFPNRSDLRCSWRFTFHSA